MKMTKEKRDLIKDTLYERCSNGEISCAQREKLIQKMNSMFVVSESTNQTTNTEEREFSPVEKYNMFKESVYEKYNKKQITLEQREELLERARDRFFTVSE